MTCVFLDGRLLSIFSLPQYWPYTPLPPGGHIRSTTGAMRPVSTIDGRSLRRHFFSLTYTGTNVLLATFWVLNSIVGIFAQGRYFRLRDWLVDQARLELPSVLRGFDHSRRSAIFPNCRSGSMGYFAKIASDGCLLPTSTFAGLSLKSNKCISVIFTLDSTPRIGHGNEQVPGLQRHS